VSFPVLQQQPSQQQMVFPAPIEGVGHESLYKLMQFELIHQALHVPSMPTSMPATDTSFQAGYAAGLQQHRASCGFHH
jgi:hypothetical protein